MATQFTSTITEAVESCDISIHDPLTPAQLAVIAKRCLTPAPSAYLVEYNYQIHLIVRAASQALGPARRAFYQSRNEQEFLERASSILDRIITSHVDSVGHYPNICHPDCAEFHRLNPKHASGLLGYARFHKMTGDHVHPGMGFIGLVPGHQDEPFISVVVGNCPFPQSIPTLPYRVSFFGTKPHNIVALKTTGIGVVTHVADILPHPAYPNDRSSENVLIRAKTGAGKTSSIIGLVEAMLKAELAEGK